MAAKHSPRALWLLLLAPSLACGGVAANRAQTAPVAEATTQVTQTGEPGAERADGSTPRDDVTLLLHEIRDLNAEIRELRQSLGLGAWATCGWRDPPVCAPEPQPEHSCIPKPPQTERCQDVCSIGERICENASEICVRASHANDNAWAADKCAGAKSSCRAAGEKCCACTDPRPPGSPPLIL